MQITENTITPKIVMVCLSLEGDYLEGEYSLSIEGCLGGIDIESRGGESDIDLIGYAIADNIEEICGDWFQGYIQIILQGHTKTDAEYIERYFDILSVNRLPYI